MHPNQQTVQRFYDAFARLDADTMAACYAPQARFEDEIPSSAIGEEIMTRLQSVDQIAYVRFASVYREFRDIDELAKAIDQLRKGGKVK